MKLHEQTKKLVKSIITDKLITEKEINLIKNRLNQGKIPADFIPEVFQRDLDISLESSQIEKGKSWLVDHYFMKNGQLRSMHSLHSEVIDIFKNIDTISFAGFSDQSNQYRPFYTPIYCIKSGNKSLQYYMNGGKVIFC